MDVGAVLTVSSQLAGVTALTVTVHTKAADFVRRRSRVSRDADTARRLLGLHKPPVVAYRHDSVHPLYSDAQKLHPDNLSGLVAASGNDYRRAEAHGTLRIEDDLRVSETHDLALIGSPTAEGLSRAVFGYVPEGDDSDSLILGPAPLDLPYRWMISKAEVDEHAYARRFVRKRGLVARPNWRIEGPQIHVPKLNEDGLLLEDYLLVTRVRNYLSPAALDAGHFIVSFGGAHGTGTRALELLYRDESVLKKVADQLRKEPASFQLLFRVGDINHDPAKGSFARTIDLVGDAIIIPDKDAAWRTATQIAQENLRELPDHHA